MRGNKRANNQRVPTSDELVAQAILALAEATEQEGVTLADYLRLLQLSNDLTSTLPLPITAGWMSECEPEEWNHDG